MKKAIRPAIFKGRQTENYHYLRLDKGNYRRILQAVEAATGLDVEVLEEE